MDDNLDPTEEALLAFAEKVLRNSYAIEQMDVDNLDELGFSEKLF